MRLHHLNCISTCPLGGRLTDGRSASIVERGRLTCHCVLVETEHGLVLLDTGLGLRDVADPKGRLSRLFLLMLQPEFRESMTAIRQISRMGFKTSDVRHIVLTHLDFDHAGGLDDFPKASIHLLQRERDDAVLQDTWLDRQRFRPQQWSSQGRWITYRAAAGEDWAGFQCVRDLVGLPPEILLIPLPGHTHGHSGVAVQDGARWHLLAGDAYFDHGEMDYLHTHCTLGLRAYQWLMEKNRAQRLDNEQRLRLMHHRHGHEVELFCSHDVVEFERLAGRSARVPAAALVNAGMATGLDATVSDDDPGPWDSGETNAHIPHPHGFQPPASPPHRRPHI